MKNKGGGRSFTHYHMRVQKQQIYCSEQLLPSIRSVIYGAAVKWCNNKCLPETVEFENQDTLATKVPPEPVCQLTQSETPDLRSLARWNLVQILAENTNVLRQQKIGASMPRCRNHKIGRKICSTSWRSGIILLEEMGFTNPCREYSHLREEFKSYPKGVVDVNTRIGSILEVLVTTQFGRFGIEDKTDSLARDGPNSWDVINRGVERYVTELWMECTVCWH